MNGWDRAFTMEGLNLERFLRQAAKQGVTLRRVVRRGRRKLTAQARESDLPALQTMAMQGGWQFTPGKRQGLGVLWDALCRRWLLAAMVVLGTAVILGATQIMWRVDILDAGPYAPDIATTLEDLGVRAPMLKAAVHPGDIRDALEFRYPRIAWFECGWRGMSLTVRAVRGTMPRTDLTADVPCDVLATRDGIVYSIVTRAGTPAVAIGDLVRAGDVLIKGEERTSDGMTRPVAAQGTVMARTWLESSVRIPLTETLTTATGREQTVWTLRSPWFDLWPLPESEFAQQDVAIREMPVGGFFLPLTLHTETRIEVECTQRRRETADVRAEGEAAALRKLHEKIGPEESLVDIWGNCSIIEDEILLSVATGELLVDITR